MKLSRGNDILMRLPIGLPIALLVLLVLGCTPSRGAQSLSTTSSPVAEAEEKPTFTPPDAEQRKEALGREPEPIFTHLVDFFEPIPTPGSRDWLASHEEAGQTYRQYELSLPNRPDDTRSKIYILPLGKFEADDPPLDQVREYTGLFFGLPVVLLESLPTPDVTKRTNDFSRQEQWHAGELLDTLESELPDDAYCLLGVTMTDIYPDEEWNYVFGLASLKRRVGVYSLARYDPKFFGDSRGESWRVDSLEKSCKVLAHETGHMLGMAHCIYYDCLMNGSNNLAEMDRQNSFLCPICLRKLKHALGIDLHIRYQNLLRFFDRNELKEQAEWLRNVLR